MMFMDAQFTATTRAPPTIAVPDCTIRDGEFTRTRDTSTPVEAALAAEPAGCVTMELVRVVEDAPTDLTTVDVVTTGAEMFTDARFHVTNDDEDSVTLYASREVVPEKPTVGANVNEPEFASTFQVPSPGTTTVDLH